MALRIEPYKVKGSQFSLKTGGIDVHHVHDIPQLPNGSTLAQAAKASDATIPFRMPVKGQRHPTVPGITCDDVIAREFMGSPSKAIVQVVWKSLDPAGDGDMSGSGSPTVVRIISSSRMTTTAFDAKGQPIKVEYKPNPGPNDNQNSGSGAGTPGAKIYAVKAPIFEPGDIVEIERTEMTSPWLLRKRYRRKLNADSIWGEKPRRFLMLGISGSKEIFGTGASALAVRPFRNTYAMEYRPPSPEGDGWDFTGVYIDSRTGQPPPDVNPENREFKNEGDNPHGKGWRRFRLYNSAPFAPLRFPDIRR